MANRPERDFFISYTASDQAWAEWIARVLEDEGFTTWLQAWDIAPGHDFLHEMQRAASRCRRTLAVLSPRYSDSTFGELEYRVPLKDDPSGEQRLLIPVRVQQCEPPALLGSRVYIDLLDLDERTARDQLLRGVALDRPRGTSAPFPGNGTVSPDSGDRSSGTAAPAFPGRPGPQGRERLPTAGASDVSSAGADVQWLVLREERPKIEELLGPDHPLLGHQSLRGLLLSRRDGAEPVALALLSGPAGSGKSALLRWLARADQEPIVHAGDMVEQLRRRIPGSELDVEQLIDRLRPTLRAAGADAVLAYDDIDHELRHSSIVEFIRAAFDELDPGLLVVTTSTALATELFAVPTRVRELDRRSADADEFNRFLDAVLDAALLGRGVFTRNVRQSLYDLSEQTADFRTVHYLMEMLLAHHRQTGTSTTLGVWRNLLAFHEQDPDVQLPAVAGLAKLTFRRKDKSELLAALLQRLFPSPSRFAEIAAARLDGFEAAGFLTDVGGARRAYLRELTLLCHTRSPGDLVVALLDEEQVRQEVERLRLDPAQLIGGHAAQAHLLVRGLGFTLVDPPIGLNAFRGAVQEARGLVDDPDRALDHLIRATRTVAQHVDDALRDLLHFWATYLFSSVAELVERRNAHEQGARVQVRSLASEQVVGLLHFLNREAAGEEFKFRLASLELDEPLSRPLLAACDRFVRHRRVVLDTLADGQAEARPDLRDQCSDLVGSAADLLDRARDGSFPTVIKLAEIVFDEYSRRIFRGVDSEGNEVRFGMTERQDADDLVVAAHYYMLPNKRMSVNPSLVPRSGRRGVWFDAHRYDNASSTQRRQMTRLLRKITLTRNDRVLDVGCGTGSLAVAVAEDVRHVHGIDVSPEMLQLAKGRVSEAGLDNVTFDVAHVLEYEPGEEFDVVLSSSAMHWITPAEKSYERLYRCLRRGGRLAVHQGGHGTYRGLREVASRVVGQLELDDWFAGWTYPLYYPTTGEYQDLLESVGLDHVEVESCVTDGSESPTLVHDFAAAGLLPYLHALPETQRDAFRTVFLEEAERSRPDLYTHRLYATARRP